MAKHKSRKSTKSHKKRKITCDQQSEPCKKSKDKAFCMTCSHAAKKHSGRITKKDVVYRGFSSKGLKYIKCSNGNIMKKGFCEKCGGKLSVVCR
jgi:hypothetical protein